MGDHRAEIKVEFTIHGKTYNLHLYWINYVADDRGLDQRVVDFFEDSWTDAFDRFNQQVHEHFAREHAAEIEAKERAMLVQLKTKYET